MYTSMSSNVSSFQITELKPIKTSVLKLCNSGTLQKKVVPVLNQLRITP
jgi:hypothetical protein